VLGIEHKNNKITSVLTCNPKNMKIGAKKLKEYKADYFFSTMPLKTLILSMDPLPPKKVICAATKLCYRILITVNFIVNKKDICPDHWIYVHEKDVGIVRIDNMSNFSMKMTNNPNYTSLSLEYFTFYGSEFWSKSDKELIKLGKREIEKIGFMNAETIIDGMVLREPEAYPVYDEYYQESLKIVRDYLAQFSNLHLMGRNGLHQYNNMDTAMLSAFKVVDTVLREVKIEKTQARRDDAIKQVTV
jgi:protoporphyrinogen oxidase